MKNYLKEMIISGYKVGDIDDFYHICLPYLGNKFFPDKNVKILDIGSGHGRCLFPLKEAGWQNLWAIDIDDFNKDIFQKNGINFSKIDAENEKFPYENDFFDVVLSFHLIEHLHSPYNYMAEVYRVLKKDGIHILVTPDWQKQYKVFWRDYTHLHPYDKESIPRLLRSYDFEPVSIQSFGVFRGLGKLGIWKFIKPLMFTGKDIFSICIKK